MGVPTTTNATDETLHRARRVETYLKNRLDDRERPLWVKSRHVANDLEYTSREVGMVWTLIRSRDNGLAVSKRAETSSITWEIERTDNRQMVDV